MGLGESPPVEIRLCRGATVRRQGGPSLRSERANARPSTSPRGKTRARTRAAALWHLPTARIRQQECA